MRYYAAPMEGITGRVWRCAHHRYFPGADRYYTPFLSTASDYVFRRRELRELLPENNPGFTLVPQLLSKSAPDFLRAADALWEMGYGEVNLNLGCPSGTVTAKGKGSALLGEPGALDALLDGIFSRAEGPVSVKTRLGLTDGAEFSRLLEIFNRYPLAELVIHARTRTDMYAGPVRMSDFEAAAARSRAGVCYNGSLTTAAQCAAFADAHPGVGAVMLGRGLIADPALIRKCQGGPGADIDALRAFHGELFSTYSEEMGSRRNAMMRMKELWRYLICLFADDGRYARRLARAKTADDFLCLTETLFDAVPLRSEAVDVH